MVDLNSNRSDDVLALVAKFKDEALVPMKEDIAEWLEALLDPAKFDPVELLTTLQTGIVACQVCVGLTTVKIQILTILKFFFSQLSQSPFKKSPKNCVNWCSSSS